MTESSSRRAPGAKGGVSLEPLGQEHAAATFRWVCDPEIARNLGLRRVPSLERTLSWIASASASDSTFAFAILSDGAHVGNVVLDQLDRHLGSARLSIYLGDPATRGRGAGRSAMRLALSEAFGAIGLRKVWLTVHAGNAAAIRLYVALGFLVEGVLREEFLLDGRYLPALRMGLLASEFRPESASSS